MCGSSMRRQIAFSAIAGGSALIYDGASSTWRPWSVAEFDGNKQLLASELAELMAEAWTAIAAYVGAELRDRHAAEDVVQEIGHAISQGSERYDSTRPFLNWAFGVARIQVLRHY